MRTRTIVVWAAACTLLAVGCAPSLQGLRPAAPVAPSWTTSAPPAFTWRSDKPSSTVRDEVEGKVLGQGTPQGFPVRPGAVIVVAVPSSALASGNTAANAKADHGQRDIIARFRLISAFLAAGYKVKDAGVLGEVTFRMQRHPGRDTTTRTTVRTDSAGDGKTTTTQTQTRGSDEWWYRNQGLVLHLTDPTSLWGPELVDYSHLNADYFLRVFDFSLTATERRVTLRRNLDAEDLAALRLAVRDYNNAAQRYNAEVRAHAERVLAYQAAHAQYRIATRTWAKQNAFILTRTPGGWPVRVARPNVPSVPSLAPLVDFDQARQSIEAATVVPTRLWTASVLLELVDARKGHVVWAGNLQSSAVDDANEPAQRAVTAITLELARQSRR